MYGSCVRGGRCLRNAEFAAAAGSQEDSINSNWTFPLALKDRSWFLCVGLVCYTNFSIFELCLKPSLQLLSVGKEAAKVSSYPQKQVRGVLVFVWN